jgi:hypothetical protein
MFWGMERFFLGMDKTHRGMHAALVPRMDNPVVTLKGAWYWDIIVLINYFKGILRQKECFMEPKFQKLKLV